MILAALLVLHFGGLILMCWIDPAHLGRKRP